MTPNPLEALLAEATERHWCTRRACTTCGSTEFRTALRRLAGADGQRLTGAMSDAELSAWYGVDDLGGAIRQAFDSLPARPAVDAVLAAWRERLAGHYRIADAVMFHVVARARRRMTKAPGG